MVLWRCRGSLAYHFGIRVLWFSLVVDLVLFCARLIWVECVDRTGWGKFQFRSFRVILYFWLIFYSRTEKGALMQRKSYFLVIEITDSSPKNYLLLLGETAYNKLFPKIPPFHSLWAVVSVILRWFVCVRDKLVNLSFCIRANKA